MSGALGEYFDLARVSRQPVRWAGTVSIASLPRLTAVIADTSGEATVQLQAMDDGSQVSVEGNVDASLVLSCQRCFGNLKLPVKAEFRLAWVRSEQQAVNLPESYEPLLSVSGRVKIRDLIEDELLLALPMVALHAAPEECSATVRGGSEQIDSDAQAPGSKPFVALKALKHR